MRGSRLESKDGAGLGNWLPDMDLNHDKQIQSLLCYRYTIGQTSAFKVNAFGLGVKAHRRLNR